MHAFFRKISLHINFKFFLTVIINILHNYGDVIEKMYK